MRVATGNGILVGCTLHSKRENAGHVQFYCDAVMFRRQRHNSDTYEVLGMSVMAPEQALKALQAQCATPKEEDRTTLYFEGKDESGKSVGIQAKWTWPWRSIQTTELLRDAWHMVAIADHRLQREKDIGIAVKGDGQGKIVHDEHVIVPPEPTVQSTREAIYQRLLDYYSAPLIPVGREGQPDWERAAAIQWRDALTTEIIGSKHWTRLTPHPAQKYAGWTCAGVLSLTDADLDSMVSRLLKDRRLRVPVPPGESGAHLIPNRKGKIFGTLDQYLATYTGEMARRVEEGVKPLFIPGVDAFGPEVMDILQRPGRFPMPKAAQAVSVEGLLRASSHVRSIDLTGEMGTGKTPMGAWVARAKIAAMGRAISGVITCPNQLVYKWKAHLEKIVDGCKVVIVQDYRDLLHLRTRGVRPTGTQSEFWILPRDKAKLSYAWRPAAIRRAWEESVTDDEGREHKFTAEEFFCPVCGAKQMKVEDEKLVPVGRDYFATPDGKPRTRRNCMGTRFHVRNTRKENGQLVCDIVPRPCNAQLWQAHNGHLPRRLLGGRWVEMKSDPNDMPRPGTCPRRMSPAEWIWRYLGRRRRDRFDLYIADEVHELGAEASLQGQMYGWLCARSNQVVNATGTLSGGYASNLLYRLWRNQPQRLRMDGMVYSAAGHNDFIRSYGVLQVEKKFVPKNGEGVRDLCLGKGRCISKREKALPGISPLLYARYLLPCSVFVRLQEMERDLPPFHEFVHTVPLNPQQTDGLIQMRDEFDAHRERMMAMNLPCRAWSAARHAFLKWPDRPWPTDTVWDRDEYGAKLEAFKIPELSADVEYPKERRLRRIIQLQRARGRKSWVFTEMTGDRWEVAERLVNYLSRYGLRACVLRTQQSGGPKPEDREAWIEARQNDYDVIISNPNLVKTGLDIYAFPTLIFYYCGDSTYTLRQASRRAWRLGQTKACEVYYLVYGGVDAMAYKCSPKWAKKRAEAELRGETEKVKVPPYLCIQSASLSLMAQKMDASLGLEGEFSAEGLAAMAESTDIASALAKVLAGKLQVDDPKTAFAKYRSRLEAIMPSITRAEGEDPVAPLALPAPATPARRPLPPPRLEPDPAPVPVAPAPAPRPAPPAPVVPAPVPVREVFEPAPPAPPVVRPVPLVPKRPAAARRTRTLTGLMAMAELLAPGDPELAAQVMRDVEALGRLAR